MSAALHANWAPQPTPPATPVLPVPKVTPRRREPGNPDRRKRPAAPQPPTRRDGCDEYARGARP